ncbi:DUF2252 domain-containing protein [Blastococcus sp. CT_GayMR20]|uniref:DUF2252 domain-containing protein n=1 Tax=Blastococcus sp. CT_GayMR20 TaxID=2559609 RepID=UPI001073BAB7|nr:DUF2252 domain-containing protein [Blastococcus sp. CT_GayMR20]TFV92954.1 DUF2252 domain-containing protein [Blastococcus sp. CT_GayMR20]
MTTTLPAPRAATGRAEASARLTRDQRIARGKAARAEVPRSGHAEFVAGANRADPLALLIAEDTTRVPELLPIRYGRMASSAFAFYRGAALPMASDLARTPRSGIDVQLCGDAHLSNFGLFASPERHVVFDINDFDETVPGPWEWDVKRLATSIEIAGRSNGYSSKARREAVLATVAAYRRSTRIFAGMDPLEVWYAHADMKRIAALTDGSLSRRQRKTIERTVAKAQTKDNMGALDRFATVRDGVPRLDAEPPLVVPVRDLLDGGAESDATEDGLRRLLSDYRDTLQPERRVLLDRYRLVDMARKVVGVGSVGTRSWMLLLVDDNLHPLFLQAKEAGPSALEQFVGTSRHDNGGQRVVVGQRLMQAVSDIFLGWVRATGLDGVRRDFYLRQLRDWKGSAEVETMLPEGMRVYGELCGWTLARAHARAGDPVAVAAYLGGGPSFDEAVRAFAESYADQNERDHRALLDAIASGRVVAEAGR